MTAALSPIATRTADLTARPEGIPSLRGFDGDVAIRSPCKSVLETGGISGTGTIFSCSVRGMFESGLAFAEGEEKMVTEAPLVRCKVSCFDPGQPAG
jgi:hypothetical protein